jgi:formylglycine-generating enzyme required for sulfatase activity
VQNYNEHLKWFITIGLFSVMILEGCGDSFTSQENYINSLGMEMVRVNPGTFRMENDGEIDLTS